MEVHDSVHEHGIDDDDIRHAIEHAMAIDDLDDDARLYLGPSGSAALLEVVMLVRADGAELVIHAMPMTPKCRRLLPAGES